MDWGDLMTGIFIGTGAGFVAGMCVPEKRKGVWFRNQQSKVANKWDQYEETKDRLEKEREEYWADKKKKK